MRNDISGTATRSAAEPRRQGNELDLAQACFQAREFDAAEMHFRRHLATHPRDLVALNNAALVAKALGRPEVALARLGKAVRYHPQSAQSHFNLANTLQEVGRLDEAIAGYQRAIDLKPDYVKAYLNCGNALDRVGRHAEAARSYRRALALGGDHAETHSNLGNCHKAQGKYREALTHFICAATLEPDRAPFHYDLGMTRFEIRDYEEAIVSFQRVLELEPDHAGASSLLLYIHQIACDWTETARLAPLVRAATDRAWAAGACCGEGPLENISRDADPERNRRVAQDAAAPFAAAAQLAAQRRRPAARRPRVRLGYLSADFRDHAVAHVMAGVFERHDRARFEVFAYSHAIDDGSVWRRRIAQASEHFVDLTAVDDHAAVGRIQQDEIDILVDLTLWTHGNRARICAARPAAVQVQYLGFPGTSAAPFYDYAVVDRTVVPPEHRPCWSESLVYLPHCYFVPDSTQAVAITGLRRSDCGLPDAATVFCSFNQGYKIEPRVFGAWMRILAEVPDSVLWLSSAGAWMEKNLAAAAGARGIDPSRLIFAARLPDKAHHLERLALADIALDTLAYNGHTTTSDMLWAGVPVISVPGGHFASRVGASMLIAAGLPDLVAADSDDYVRIAVELATSSSRLGEAKVRVIAARGQPLFDTAAAVAAMESAFVTIHERRLRGRAAEDVAL